MLDYCRKAVQYFIGLRKFERIVYDDRMCDCIEWYNDYLEFKNFCRRGYKKKQCYIFDPTKVGKSMLIEKLIGRCSMKFVLSCSREIFYARICFLLSQSYCF